MPRDGAAVAPATMAQIQIELAELRRGHALLLGAIEKRRAAVSNTSGTTAPSEQDRPQESVPSDRRARGEPESLSDPASTRCAWIVALVLALLSVVGPALIGFISQLRGPAPPPPNAYPSFASYTAAQQMQAQKQQHAATSSSAERRVPPVLHVRRERIRRPVESVGVKFSHGFQLRAISRIDFHPPASENETFAFPVKRIISVRVHARLLSGDANSSLWQKVARADLLRRKLLDSSPSYRSGLIRIELLYQSVNAPRKWLAEYNDVQDRLLEANAYCTHERLALRSWGPEFAAADIYHCDSNFVTLPPSQIAVGVACNASSASVFCPNSAPPTHPVGFASLAALHQEEAQRENMILNFSRVPKLAIGRPHSARVAQMLRTNESAASADGDDCQDFQYLRGALEQSLLGPRLGAALNDRNRSSVHVLSSDPLVVQILDFVTDDERAALLQSVDPAIGATASSEALASSRSSPRPEQSIASNSSEILASLDARVRELTGFPLVDAPLALHYRHVGSGGNDSAQEPAHVDWFPPRAGQSRALGARGQRTVTLLLALDSVADSQRTGGAIAFPRLPQPLLVHPRRNAALLIYNVRANGDGDWRTAHGVTPIVTPGVAWTGVALFMRDPRLVGPPMACPLAAADGNITV